MNTSRNPRHLKELEGKNFEILPFVDSDGNLQLFYKLYKVIIQNRVFYDNQNYVPRLIDKDNKEYPYISTYWLHICVDDEHCFLSVNYKILRDFLGLIPNLAFFGKTFSLSSQNFGFQTIYSLVGNHSEDKTKCLTHEDLIGYLRCVQPGTPEEIIGDRLISKNCKFIDSIFNNSMTNLIIEDRGKLIEKIIS